MSYLALFKQTQAVTVANTVTETTILSTGVGAADDGMSNTAAASIDTTAAITMDITLQWGTASASNTCTYTDVMIELI